MQSSSVIKPIKCQAAVENDLKKELSSQKINENIKSIEAIEKLMKKEEAAQNLCQSINSPDRYILMNPSLTGSTTIPLLSDQETSDRSYHVGHVLSQGGSGTVYAGVRLLDGLLVSIKHIPKSSIADWSEINGITIKRRPCHRADGI